MELSKCCRNKLTQIDIPPYYNLKWYEFNDKPEGNLYMCNKCGLVYFKKKKLKPDEEIDEWE